MHKPLNYLTLTPEEAWPATLILEDAREAVSSDSFPFESFRNLLHRTSSWLVSYSICLFVFENTAIVAFFPVMNLPFLPSEQKLLFDVLRGVKVILPNIVLLIAHVWKPIGDYYYFSCPPNFSAYVISAFQTCGLFQNGSGIAAKLNRFPFSALFFFLF